MQSADTTEKPIDKPKVLLIAYNFPPLNNGGVLRGKMFAKYWGRLGWDVHVLTTNILGNLPAQYEGALILRSTELRSIIQHLRPRKKATNVGDRNNIVTLPSPNTFFANRIRQFYRKWILIPDVTITWAIFSFWKALVYIKNNPRAVIVTTSPPESSHLIGLLLKLNFGCRWIMDLRDPWTFDPINLFLQKEGFRLSLDRKIERACFSHADSIILNTPSAATHYGLLYPAYSPKMQTVTNGFDPEEIADAKNSHNPAPTWLKMIENFRLISHVGTFGRHGNSNIVPDQLLRALRVLLDDGVLSIAKHRVVFAGQQHESTIAAIAAYRLTNLILLPGLVPHREALKLMDMSDILLVADPNDSGEFYVHGKLYEYLAMKKSIVAILPEGSSCNLLKELGFTSIVKPKEYKNLIHILSDIISGNYSSYKYSNDRIKRYSYEYIAATALGIDLNPTDNVVG